MKKLMFSLCIAAAMAILPAAARADIAFTIYCTGGNTCSTTNPGSGQFWSFTGGVTTSTSGGVQHFDMNLNIAASASASAANLLSWSLQFGPSSDTISNLQVVSSAGGTLVAGKSNNGGDTCNSNVSGAICDSLLPSGLAITTGTGLHWEVKGDFTGQFGTDCGAQGTCLVLLADSNFASNGHTAFAISQDVNGGTTTPTPEPASLALFGTGLLGFAGVLRRKLNK